MLLKEPYSFSLDADRAPQLKASVGLRSTIRQTGYLIARFGSQLATAHCSSDSSSRGKSLPRISVVIPTYNRAALLAETVESVQKAGRDLEVIVVDDASTDDTPKVCAGLAGVRYLRLRRNCGPSAARNAGILASSAEFIALMDDDDLRLPDTIDLQVSLLEETPEAAVVYGRVLIGEPGRRLPTGQVSPARCPQGDIFWELMAGNFLSMPSVITRRRSIVEAGLFRPDIQLHEDWEMWLRLAERWPFRVTEEIVAIVCDWNLSWNLSGKHLGGDQVQMARWAFRIQDDFMRSAKARAAPAARRREARRMLRDLDYGTLIYRAAEALAAGDKPKARAYLREAVAIRPFRAEASWWLLRSLFVRSARSAPGAVLNQSCPL
jgi:glycosyltransferase involved in cell wall biosynthesis